MGAVGDIAQSERGLFAVAIVVAATVLVVVGKLTSSDWTSFVQIIFATYVAGKSATSAVSSWSQRTSKISAGASMAPDQSPATTPPSPK